MGVENHIYNSECIFPDHEWYKGDLSEEDEWFDIVGYFAYACIQLKQIKIVDSPYQEKKHKRLKTAIHVLDRSNENNFRAADAHKRATQLIEVIEWFISNEVISQEFVEDWGTFSSCIGVLRQRLNLKDYKQKGSGTGSAKKTSKQKQRFWIACWMQENLKELNNKAIRVELSKLSDLLHSIPATGAPDFFPTDWPESMLRTEGGKLTKAFNTSFDRIGKSEIERLLKFPPCPREEIPSAKYKDYPRTKNSNP